MQKPPFKKSRAKPGEHIYYSKPDISVSTVPQKILRFHQVNICLSVEYSRLIFPKKMLQYSQRKGDTNVQVNPSRLNFPSQGA
jgi:hypothetical protein